MSDVVRFLNFDYLRQTELVTAQAFADSYDATFETTMPDLLDSLFRLTYFIEPPTPPREDELHPFVAERCIDLPYSLRATWLLARVGYYPEAATLIRRSLETFVQLRYFARYPARLVPHLVRRSSKDSIQFKAMFEEFAPGYYVGPYRELSSIAHDTLGSSVLNEMTFGTDGVGRRTFRLGCKYSGDVSGFIGNNLLMVVSGHLRFFPLWFPSYGRLAADTETEDRRVRALATLSQWQDSHRATYPHSQEWLGLCDLLMGATDPELTQTKSLGTRGE